MIEQLDTPEQPIVKPNTHSFTERIFITYNEDGTASATVTKVKGYYENGKFVKDHSTRTEITSDGVELATDIKASEVAAVVKAKIKDKEDKAAQAKAAREQALAEPITVDEKKSK